MTIAFDSNLFERIWWLCVCVEKSRHRERERESEREGVRPQSVVARQTKGQNHSGFQAVTRFTFESKAPFHPGRLHALIKQKLASVIRLKGTFWVASRPELVGDLDIAGGNTAVSCAGHWWASVPPEERPKNPAFRAYLESTWHPQFGDRNQDLTLAGVGLNEAELRQALNACLLTDNELAEPENWMRYNDPFKWPKR